MTDSRTILVPIDFSDCAITVVRHAADRAREAKAELVLLHVTQLPEGLSESTIVRPSGAERDITIGEHLRNEARTLMTRYVAEASGRGIAATPRIEQGSAADVIVRVARQVGAERIVMGTHGRTGLSRLVLGSVARRVKRDAPCAVEALRTEYKAQCDARSCAWCDSHRSPAEREVAAELDG